MENGWSDRECYETALMHEVSDFSAAASVSGDYFMLRNRQVTGCFVTSLKTRQKIIFKIMNIYWKKRYLSEELIIFSLYII